MARPPDLWRLKFRLCASTQLSGSLEIGQQRPWNKSGSESGELLTSTAESFLTSALPLKLYLKVFETAFNSHLDTKLTPPAAIASDSVFGAQPKFLRSKTQGLMHLVLRLVDEGSL